MQVKKIMSKNVITIPITASLQQALALMKESDIRHLPVVEGKKLIGLVSDRDLGSALFPSMIEEIAIKDLLITDVITVGPETMLEDAVRLVYRHKIGCLPVVDEARNLKGIITVADMLAALIQLMGYLSASSRLDVVLPGRPEALEEACHVIRKNGGRIISISATQSNKEQTVHLFRLEKQKSLNRIIDDLTNAGHQVVSSMN